MHTHGFGIALRPPLPPCVLEITDEFLLLGIDRDGRLLLLLKPTDPRADVAELSVAVGMLRPFPLLLIRLQAVVTVMQQLRDRGVVSEGCAREDSRVQGMS